MAKCVTLSSIGAAANCTDYDNRGGIVSKILLGYHSSVATWPDLPAASSSPMDLATAGKLNGDLALASGEKMVEINFIDEEGEFHISLSGEKGARCAHYELDIMRSKISAEILGLINACKDEGLVIVVIDANGNKYLMGDELVPARMIDGDGAGTGRARTDRNATTLNFEYYGQRCLVYDGDIDDLTTNAG